MGKSRSQSSGGKGGAGRSPGSGVVDRVMVKRVEAHVAAGAPLDVDRVAEELRRSYREYQRIKTAPFRALVARAVQNVRGRADRERAEEPQSEVTLREMEHRRLQRCGSWAAPGDLPSSSSDDGRAPEEESGSEPELNEEAAMEMAAGGGSKRLNVTLLSMYGRSGAAASAASGEGESGRAEDRGADPAGASPTSEPPVADPQEQQGGEQRCEEGEEVRGGEKPAFATLEAVAAAAAGASRRPPSFSPCRPVAEQPQEGDDAQAQKDKDKQRRQRPAGQERWVPVPSDSQTRQHPAAKASSSKRQRRESAPPASEKKAGGASQRPLVGMRMSGGSSAISDPSPVTYADLGGIEHVLDDITELIVFPMAHPEVYTWLGVLPPRGVLLHGPPGCGKTALANAIANECGVPFLRVSAPEIVSGMSGESEAKLRELFREAADNAPCIVFIDEIDAIAAKRETAQRQMEHRIVAQMLTCMDDLTEASRPPETVANGEKGDHSAQTADAGTAGAAAGRHVVVLAATNRPDALDSALRRAGRFDREIAMGIPSEAARSRILEVQTRKLRLSGEIDFHAISKRTPGFVGADLAALVKEAAALAVKRCFQRLTAEAPAPMVVPIIEEGSKEAEAAAALQRTQAWSARARDRLPLTPLELDGLAISMRDLEEAVGKVQPSVRREGFATTPDVTWEDVGSLTDIREELSFAITEPIKFPKRFEAMGLTAACGVLLFGPPGCGKTLVAKAVANESGANFISIKGPELLNKYMGESERAVRQLFSRARAAAPCVLFFDELDALAPRRGTDGNAAAERVVNQLLTEMDGIDGRQAVYLVAATNRPDMIDPALLRPGRLDKILYVPLPAADGRSSILATLTRKTPMAHDVDLGEVAGLAQGFSGADMAALVREACIKAMREALGTEPMTEIDEQDRAAVVEQRHFLAALSTINPSVSPKDQRVYNALRNKLKSSRGRLASTAPTEAENLMPTPMEGASSDAAGLNPGEDVNPMDSA